MMAAFLLGFYCYLTLSFTASLICACGCQQRHKLFNVNKFSMLALMQAGFGCSDPCPSKKVSGHGYKNGFDLLLMLDVRWPYYIGTEHLLVTSR